MLSAISSAATISLHAYFEESNWPLNKTLPRGAEFLCGPLGDILRKYCLKKTQVARQLLNYKRREVHEYAGFHPAQPVRSRQEDM